MKGSLQQKVMQIALGVFLPGTVLIVILSSIVLKGSQDKSEKLLEQVSHAADQTHIQHEMDYLGKHMEDNLQLPKEILDVCAQVLLKHWPEVNGPNSFNAEDFLPGATKTWWQSGPDSSSVILLPSYLFDGQSVEKDVPKLITWTDELNHLIPSLMHLDPHVLQIYFVGPEGASFFRLYPWQDIGSAIDQIYPEHGSTPYWDYFPGIYDFWVGQLEKEAEPEEMIVYSALYVDGLTGVPIQTVFYPLVLKGQILGIMCLDVDRGFLNRDLFENEETGAAFIYDENGSILLRDQKTAQFFPEVDLPQKNQLSSPDYSLDLLGLELLKPDEPIIQRVQFRDREATLGVYPLPSFFKWEGEEVKNSQIWAAFLLPPSRFAEELKASSDLFLRANRRMSVLLPFLLLIILSGMAWALYVTTRHVSPGLQALASQAAQLQKGDFEASPLPRSNDEIGLVSQAMDKLRINLAENTRLKQEHLRKLQSEIRNRKNMERDQLRLVKAVEHSADSIEIMDIHGKILYVNPAFSRMTGYEAVEVLGEVAAWYREKSQDGEDGIWDALGRDQFWSGRFQIKSKTGADIIQECSISTIRDERGHLVNYVLVGRDVTHDVQMEGVIRRKQRLESIGTLAGGIAHDFNNFLTPILGRAEWLLSYQRTEEEKEALLEILQASKRARDLIRQILVFSKNPETEKQACQISDEISACIRFFSATLPKTIHLDTDIDPKSGWVFMSPAQLHQVLLNLMTNACHAMEPRGGRLAVKVGPLTLKEQQIEHLTPELRDQNPVLFTVTDSGVGIAEEDLLRIFDPFYSTKSVEQGTGLGLSNVHGIVESLGGVVWAESQIGQGSQFFVVLPTCAPAETDRTTQSMSQRVFNHRALVVDDEEMVLAFVEQVLLRSGFEVEAYRHAPDALNRFLQNPYVFDLVVTDQTMPELTGVELAKLIREKNPHLPILVISGYSRELLSEMADLESVSVLGKPFEMAEFMDSVSKLVQEKL